MRFGIDFGTTHTVVAVCDRGNYPVVSFFGPDDEPVDAYPTVVAEHDGELCFGLEAQARVGVPGWTFMRSFKRLLTEPGAGPHRSVPLGSCELTLLDLVASFLSSLRRDLIERSNLPVSPRSNEPLEAVIATPANARSAQRFVTLEAFRRAGFEVIAMLNEPSAAGVEYAHRYARTLNSVRQQVLVYDLGGGTFDASLVDMRGLAHEVVASAGISRLGGDDFDDVLLNLVLPLQGQERDELSPSELDRLSESCREQKERLHPNSRRMVIETNDGFVEVPVETYYALAEPLVTCTLETTLAVLASSGVAASGLAGVYVVGGASALPSIGRSLRAHFGRRVHRSAYPSASAAIGLAIAYDEGSRYTVRDRLARYFGVFRETESGAEVSFDPIFAPNVVLEQVPEALRWVVRTYRAAHNIGHFRFVECDAIDQNGAPDGELSPAMEVLFPFDPYLRDRDFDLSQMPVIRFDTEGPLIEERYSIGATGMVELDIVALDTGYAKHYELGAMPALRNEAPAGLQLVT